MFRSQDIQVFLILTIYQIFDVMMRISTWEKVHFRKYLLNHRWLSRQTWAIIDISQGNNFPESFEQFGGLGLSSRSFSI